MTIGKWISVKDELPEKEGKYLVYIKEEVDEKNEISIEWWEKQWITLEETETKIVRQLSDTPNFDLYWASRITHWMRLPEKPNDRR